LKSLHLHKANSAIAQCMVIPIAVRFLDKHFILKPAGRVGMRRIGLLVSHGDARRRPYHERRGSTGGDERSFAMQLLSPDMRPRHRAVR